MDEENAELKCRLSEAVNEKLDLAVVFTIVKDRLVILLHRLSIHPMGKAEIVASIVNILFHLTYAPTHADFDPIPGVSS